MIRLTLNLENAKRMYSISVLRKMATSGEPFEGLSGTPHGMDKVRILLFRGRGVSRRLPRIGPTGLRSGR